MFNTLLMNVMIHTKYGKRERVTERKRVEKEKERDNRNRCPSVSLDWNDRY